jgi:hypothetical protein
MPCAMLFDEHSCVGSELSMSVGRTRGNWRWLFLKLQRKSCDAL